MRVLMFGWEFPPHVSGGLGTACYGLTKSLAKLGTEILFVTPNADGSEPFPGASLISASHVSLGATVSSARAEAEPVSSREKIFGAIKSIRVKSELQPYFSFDDYEKTFSFENWNYQAYENRHIKESSNQPPGSYPFKGGYGPRLMEEIYTYARVAQQLAIENQFDVIHAHDWMTYPAGIAAKKSSYKPLIIHVHATEFDRSGESGAPEILAIEKEGMILADQIIAVSQLTKNIIVNHYGISPGKIKVVHNGVLPKKNCKSNSSLPPIGKRVITFLGRVTHQKGPGYFVDAAALVHQKFPDVHFVMAGSGDLLPKMIKKVAFLNLSSHFHFTGFLNSDNVDRVWAVSEMYVMPSVSEPFGIAPLEAIMAGVPVIISKQSDVAEVVRHAIKVDFWDVDALANAMVNLLHYKSLSNTVKENSATEVRKINWNAAAKKVNAIYYEATAKNQ